MKSKILTKEELKESVETDIAKLWQSFDIDYKKLVKWYVPKKTDEATLKEVYEELLNEDKIYIVDGYIKPYNLVIGKKKKVIVSYSKERERSKVNEFLCLTGMIFMAGGLLEVALAPSTLVVGLCIAFLIGAPLVIIGLVRKYRKEK